MRAHSSQRGTIGFRILIAAAVLVAAVAIAGCASRTTVVTSAPPVHVHAVAHYPVYGIDIIGLRISIILVGGQAIYLPDGHYHHHEHGYTIVIRNGRVIALDRIPPGLWRASTRPGRRRGRPFRGGRFTVVSVRVYDGHLSFVDLDDGHVLLPWGTYTNEFGDIVIFGEDGIRTFGVRDEIYQSARRERPPRRSETARRDEDDKPGQRWRRGEERERDEASGRPDDPGRRGRERSEDARREGEERRRDRGRAGEAPGRPDDPGAQGRDRAEETDKTKGKDKKQSEQPSGEANDAIPGARGDVYRRDPTAPPPPNPPAEPDTIPGGRDDIYQREPGSNPTAPEARPEEKPEPPMPGVPRRGKPGVTPAARPEAPAAPAGRPSAAPEKPEAGQPPAAGAPPTEDAQADKKEEKPADQQGDKKPDKKKVDKKKKKGSDEDKDKDKDKDQDKEEESKDKKKDKKPPSSSGSRS